MEPLESLQTLEIRDATPDDWDAVWEIFSDVVSAGDTYAFAPDTSREEAHEIWMVRPHRVFVAVAGRQILGTYILSPNQPGLGSHVCNAAYMVAGRARGQGIATTMCEHSQRVAVRLGYQAMQFNLVVATNKEAINLWKKLGFEIVGLLPRAFNHAERGFIDALIFFKWLGKQVP